MSEMSFEERICSCLNKKRESELNRSFSNTLAGMIKPWLNVGKSSPLFINEYTSKGIAERRNKIQRLRKDLTAAKRSRLFVELKSYAELKLNSEFDKQESEKRGERVEWNLNHTIQILSEMFETNIKPGRFKAPQKGASFFAMQIAIFYRSHFNKSPTTKAGKGNNARTEFDKILDFVELELSTVMPKFKNTFGPAVRAEAVKVGRFGGA